MSKRLRVIGIRCSGVNPEMVAVAWIVVINARENPFTEADSVLLYGQKDFPCFFTKIQGADKPQKASVEALSLIGTTELRSTRYGHKF